MTLMKQQDPERYLRIEHLVARSNFIASDSYPGLCVGERKGERRTEEERREEGESYSFFFSLSPSRWHDKTTTKSPNCPSSC